MGSVNTYEKIYCEDVQINSIESKDDHLSLNEGAFYIPIDSPNYEEMTKLLSVNNMVQITYKKTIRKNKCIICETIVVTNVATRNLHSATIVVTKITHYNNKHNELHIVNDIYNGDNVCAVLCKKDQINMLGTYEIQYLACDSTAVVETVKKCDK